MTQANGAFLTAKEARERLGISKTRMTKMLREKRITTHRREVDMRVKWLRIEDVVQLERELHETKPEVAVP